MLEEMVWRGVDGIILTSSYGMLDDRMRDFIENQPEPRLPLVYVGRHRSLPSVDFVTPQGFQGGAIAVTHLIENGHRDIACLSGDYTRDVALRRWDAYIATLKTYDIPFNPDRVAMDETTLEGGYTAMTKVLATGTGPTAVFAVNDLMALGAIEAIRDAGLSVPDDISVVGFDDIPTAALSTPRLSTVAQPSYDVGVASVEMLLRRIDDPEMEQQIKLMDCRLVRARPCAGSAQADKSRPAFSIGHPIDTGVVDGRRGHSAIREKVRRTPGRLSAKGGAYTACPVPARNIPLGLVAQRLPGIGIAGPST